MRIPWPLVVTALGACAPAVRAAPVRNPPVAAPLVASARPSPAPSSGQPVASSTSPSPAPSVPSAADRVRERLGSLTPAEPAFAAWIPFEIIDAVDRVAGELGESSAPDVHEDRVVWSLVIPASARAPDPSAFQGACDELMHTDPYLTCAVDSIAVGATDRVRIAFGWRRAPGRFAADLALPLRALSRMHTGACLVSAERTANTVELKLQVADVPTLGRTLARLTSLTPLNDLILVQMQSATLAHGTAENVTLSWPTDRVDRERADLGPDPWPTRCEEREPMSREAPPHAAITALLPVVGEHARGAIVNIAHREWIVTEGDTVADARITSTTPQGVYVHRLDRPRARPLLVRFVAQPPRPTANGALHTPGTPPPIRIPLPPEPPAPLP